MSERLTKNDTINDLEANALIDTGSQFNIIGRRLFNNLGKPELYQTALRLKGIGRDKVKPLVLLKSNIEIDELKFPVDIYVVDDDLEFDVLIGFELLRDTQFQWGEYQN